MPDSDHRSPVTIEDLLRLKRAERPAPEFWDTFERELRQKQLTALIQKRSWWQHWPQLLTRRAYLPAGITAVVAFTLVTVNQTGPGAATVVESSITPTLASRSAPAPQVALTPPIAVAVSSPLRNRQDHNALVIDDRVAVASRTPRESAGQAGPQSLVIGEMRAELLTPSARSIAANLARLEQTEPELVSVTMGNRLSASAKAVNDSPATVEFAALSSGNTRRSRMLAHYNDKPVNPAPAAPEVVRERLARRLNDLDYGDRFTRIGVKGDQVSLKF